MRIGVSGLLSDEVRLRKGTLTADRIKADYDIVANKNFLAVSAPVSRDSVITAADPIGLDLKRDSVRESDGKESLVYSGLWYEGDNATVTITQDGVVLFEDLEGEGAKTWFVNRSGEYVLTHTTYNGGVAGKVETAVFVVEGKEVPVEELTIDWGQASFVYDGQPKEPVVTVKERETALTKGTHYLVEYKNNVNVGTAKAIVKGIESYVGEVTNEFTITAAPIGPGGGDEPGAGEIPEGGLSKFDATYEYDGEGHTIKTNELVAAFRAALVGEFAVWYAVDNEGIASSEWTDLAPAYTNVGEYVIWYRVTSQNYQEYEHKAKVTIRKPLRIESVMARQRYPWNGLVDIDYELSGVVAGCNYRMVFTATNAVDGTGFDLKHVFLVDQDAAAESVVVSEASGRVIWDAKKDLPKGFRTSGMELYVDVEPER